jgi:hypothetical protein
VFRKIKKKRKVKDRQVIDYASYEKGHEFGSSRDMKRGRLE